MRALALAALVALGGACWEVTRPSLPPPEPPAPPPAASETPLPQASASEEIDEAPTAEAYVRPPPMQVGPSVHISEVVGITPGAAGAMIAPAIERLERCVSPTKGKVVIRIIAEKDRTHLRVTDQGTLDAETNHCALEALSTIEPDQAMAPSQSPSDVPQHIETQLVLSW